MCVIQDFYLNRILDTLRKHHNKKYITLDEEFHKDVNWLKKFVSQFNGVTIFQKTEAKFQVHLDACLTGVGAVCDKEVYHSKIPEKVLHLDIAILEMLNILIALRVWAKNWKNQIVHVKCDNKAVVEVLNNGKTKNIHLAAISRNIFITSATFDIELRVSHVFGKNNPVADLLSRWHQVQDASVKLELLLKNSQEIFIGNEHFTIDYNI